MPEEDRKNWVCGHDRAENQRSTMLEENLRLTPEERLRVMQDLREQFYGDEIPLSRLRRVSTDPESAESAVYGHRRLGPRVARLAETD